MATLLSLLLPCCPAWDWERRNWGTDCMWPGSNTSCCRVWRELMSYGKSKQQSSEMSVLYTASPPCEVPHSPIFYSVLGPIHASHLIAGTSYICPLCTGELQVQSCSSSWLCKKNSILCHISAGLSPLCSEQNSQ